jgi:HlyD family secretion protein
MRLLKLSFMAMFLIGCNNKDHHHQFAGYVEGENIYLASPYFGTLQKLPVQRGELVKKGDLLFRLDPNPQIIHMAQLKAELEQAKNTLIDLKKPKTTPEIEAIQAQIEQVKSQITLAQIRVNRFQKLIDKNAADRDSLDAAIANLQQQHHLKLQYEANLTVAKFGARVDQIKAQESLVDALTDKLREAQWEVNQKTLFSPESGVIFDVYYSEGEFVLAQQPVVSLLPPENIQIEFFVPLDYLTKLRVGQKISFDCDGCNKNNPAIINYISPTAEYLPPLVYSRENNAHLVFRVKASINNPLSFKPGQPVMVTV